MFYLILQVVKSVVVSNYYFGTEERVPPCMTQQYGIMLNGFVITPVNELPLQLTPDEIDETITYISYRNDEYTAVRKRYKLVHIWMSTELKNLLIPYYSQQCAECNLLSHYISNFVLLCPLSWRRDSLLEEFVCMIANNFFYADINIGQNITTSYTPFGELGFYNTFGSGYVNKVYGITKALFITDCATTCRGAPAFM